MKKIHLLAVAMAFSSLVAAQSVSLYPTPSVYIEGGPEEPILTAEAHVRNSTNDPINVAWVRENVVLPSLWKTSICDLNSCWSSSLSTQEFLLNPTPSSSDGEIMHVQFKANNQEGEGHIDVALYLAGSNTELARNTYYCSAWLVGTSRVQQTTAKVFPNPATDYIRISENDVITSANLTSTLGTLVRSFSIKGDAQLDLNDLPQGIYSLQLFNAAQTPLRTIRIVKN